MVSNNLLLFLLGMTTLSLAETDRKVGIRAWWVGVVSGSLYIFAAVWGMVAGS